MCDRCAEKPGEPTPPRVCEEKQALGVCPQAPDAVLLAGIRRRAAAFAPRLVIDDRIPSSGSGASSSPPDEDGLRFSRD